MKVGLSIVKSLIDFELPEINELVARVNSQLGGVEEIADLGAKYKDAKIVKVAECEKHPNADKLSVCKIDAGDGELVQVVCGAPNARADMWAVWLPPKSIVPSTFDDKEPFVLGARELRGVMSHGMLASGDELGINNNHEGIVDVTERDLLVGRKLEPGANFAELFVLNCYVIDIENKMFTHRPDLFGQLGVAREVAGIFHEQFTSPDWYLDAPKFAEADGLPLEAFNNAGDNSQRAMFVVMNSVEVGPSPLWLQCALVAMGAKPINNIVDATNYIMLMTAQPVHAYDYDKIRGEKIGVRMARAGEKIKLLNEKVYELDENDIVIADGEGAIGLAGIMGGFDSEVTNETKNIILEVANFDMYAVRRSSMRHGLFTDAVTRFNKGQSPLQVAPVMAKLMEMIDGDQASQVFDLISGSMSNGREVVVETGFINDRLGLGLKADSIKELLANTEVSADIKDLSLTISAPFWRTDLDLPEDIVEEVGRLYGFDKLPRELPARSTRPVDKNSTREVKQRIRDSFRRAGANEVLTYSFVHENIFKKSEQDASQAFRLSNALSPDLQYYRLTVLPSLLDKVHMNIKAGHDEFCLFEIGKGHNKKYHADDDEGLPGEMNFVDAVYASKKPRGGAPYYRVRRLAQQLALDNGFSLKFKPADTNMDYPVTAPFDLGRSAMVETADGEFIGMIGELKQSVIANFKMPQYVAAMTLDFEGLKKAIEKPRQTYAALSKYPSVSQDISLKVNAGVSYGDLFELVYEAACGSSESIDVKLEPITIYQPENDKSSKTITFRITFTSHDKTLTDKDVNSFMELISKKAKSGLEAERV